MLVSGLSQSLDHRLSVSPSLPLPFSLPHDVTPRFLLLFVLLFTAILRGGLLWGMRDNLSEDRDAYREIAENLAVHRVYGLNDGVNPPRPTAYRPPLYPVILAKLAGEGLQVTPLRVAILHWLLGIGTVWLTWVVAGMLFRDAGASGQLGLGEWRPALAALLVACDPILLHWSTFVMTETLAAFLAVLALYTLTRFHFDRRPLNAAFAGVALGLAILCRPTFLPWAGLCGIGLLFLQASRVRQPPDTSAAAKRNLHSQYVRRFANLASFGLVAAVVVFPWGYRNYQQFDKPIITTTHGGYTLHLANNDLFYDYLSNDNSSLPWNSETFDAQFRKHYEFDHLIELITRTIRPHSGSETAFLQTAFEVNDGPYEILVDEGGYKLAWKTIAARPGMFAYSCLYRLGQLWSPLPNKLTADESWRRALLRYLTAAWYLAVYVAALAGIWRLRGKLLRSPWIWGVLLCLVFSGVHAFYWSNLRMRAPLIPFVAILAAVGSTSLSAAFTKRGKPHAEAQSTQS